MPNKIEVLSPAKINLTLDVIKRLPSGYHEVCSVLHELPKLSDHIQIKSRAEDTISCDYSIPPEENLAFKALRLLKQNYNIKKHAEIKIKKNIPVAAGLGGGSSNATYTLLALNELWNLQLTRQDLHPLALQLGIDATFFLTGGTALVTGRGEIITPLPALTCFDFTIHSSSASKHLPQKTATNYAALDLKKCGHNTAKTKQFVQELKAPTQNPNKLLSLLHNDFNQLYPPLKKGRHLTGSGPSTFTVEKIKRPC